MKDGLAAYDGFAMERDKIKSARKRCIGSDCAAFDESDEYGKYLLNELSRREPSGAAVLRKDEYLAEKSASEPKVSDVPAPKRKKSRIKLKKFGGCAIAAYVILVAGLIIAAIAKTQSFEVKATAGAFGREAPRVSEIEVLAEDSVEKETGWFDKFCDFWK